MKHRRLAAAISLLAAGATVLSGCEVPHTSMAYASEVVNCGGKSAITASGSTAQANAMKRFVSAYSKSCPGHSLNYTANGSGAGITDFLAGKSDFAGSDTPLGRRPIRRRQAALRRGRSLEPAGGLRPAGHHLQPPRRLPGARRADAGRDLQRQHHALGRPGHHGAQRVDAARGHPRHLPQRQIRQHRQLPGLPAGRVPAGCGPRAPARRSRAASEPAPRATTAPRRR